MREVDPLRPSVLWEKEEFAGLPMASISKLASGYLTNLVRVKVLS
jgi:hypothetical protein